MQGHLASYWSCRAFVSRPNVPPVPSECCGAPLLRRQPIRYNEFLVECWTLLRLRLACREGRDLRAARRLLGAPKPSGLLPQAGHRSRRDRDPGAGFGSLAPVEDDDPVKTRNLREVHSRDG